MWDKVAVKLYKKWLIIRGFQVAVVVKNLLANAGDVRDTGSIPGSGRSPGEGHGNPLQYSYLENSMDRKAWQATEHGMAKSWTWLEWLSKHAQTWKRLGSWEKSSCFIRLEESRVWFMILKRVLFLLYHRREGRRGLKLFFIFAQIWGLKLNSQEKKSKF